MAVPQAQNQMCDFDALRTEGTNKIEPGRLQLIPSDLQDMDIPSLLTVEGQKMIEAHLKPDTKLTVFGNISTLFRGGGENDDENWPTVPALNNMGMGHLGQVTGLCSMLDKMARQLDFFKLIIFNVLDEVSPERPKKVSQT